MPSASETLALSVSSPCAAAAPRRASSSSGRPSSRSPCCTASTPPPNSAQAFSGRPRVDRHGQVVPPPALGELADHEPVRPQQRGHPQSRVRLARGGEGVGERDPQVVGLVAEPGEPAGLPGGETAGRRRFRQLQVVVAVPGPQPLGALLARRGEPLGAELAHGVEQEVAAGVVAVLDDGLLDQPDQGVEGARAADALGRLEPEAAGEDRELGPEPLLGRRAQVVAPGDGGAQRAVPASRGPRGAEDAEPVGQPVQ